MSKFKVGDLVEHKDGEIFKIVSKYGFYPRARGRAWQRMEWLTGTLKGLKTWCYESDIKLKIEYLFEEKM